MLKKWIIIRLVVSNLVTLGLLTYNNPERHSSLNVYTLEGKGQTREVKNYQIIVAANKVNRGSAELHYLGDPAEMENSTYYYEFYEEDPEYGPTVVYTNSASSEGGPVHILTNVQRTGSITGSYSYNEKLKTKNHYENSFFEIEWNDNDGNRYKERIELDIVNHIHIDNIDE